ncbi:MAG: hypothetical protein DMG57_25480 [Acidobacteria bacterium]|nr:MAG: hypothetical protein DMG57_25480 [Acidobacteriota bacterium]
MTIVVRLADMLHCNSADALVADEKAARILSADSGVSVGHSAGGSLIWPPSRVPDLQPGV